MRVIAAAVAFLVVGGAAASASSLLTLRSAERAFYQARIPFSEDWQQTRPNPYLIAKKPSGSPRASLPSGIGAHLIGSASYVNRTTFKSRVIYVFDSTSVASTYRSWVEHHCTCDGSVFLRARNVVYVGSRSAAVTSAIARLAR
jgi:hypothetical protein